MKKYFAGFFSGIIATILFVTGVLLLWSGPILDVSVSIPESVEMSDTFDMVINAQNPHPEIVALDNVDIPDSFFELFEVVSVSPQATPGSPVEGMGTKTWYFEIDVQPMETTTVVFVLRPLKQGQHIVNFEVSNATEDNTEVVKSIKVL